MTDTQIAENILKSWPLSPSKPIVLVGGCLGDIVATLDDLPSKGSDIAANIIDEQVGGCALNVARVLNNFNASIINAMPVGKGKWADRIKSELSEINLPINIHISDRDNGHCLALVTPDKERTFITFEGAETVFKKEDLAKIDVPDNSIIYLNGYELVLDNDLIDWVEGIENAKFIVDFGPVIYNIKQEFIEMLTTKKDVVFTLNEDEAKFLLSDLSEDTLLEYSEKYNISLVVRLGGKGVICVENSHITFVPAMKVKVVDTIGAGDCHTGALVAGLSSNLDLASSCLLGNISGAYTVGQVGAKNTAPLSYYDEKLSELIK